MAEHADRGVDYASICRFVGQLYLESKNLIEKKCAEIDDIEKSYEQLYAANESLREQIDAFRPKS